MDRTLYAFGILTDDEYGNDIFCQSLQEYWEIIEYRRFTSLHLVGGKIEVKQRNLVLDLYDGFVKLMGAAWF